MDKVLKCLNCKHYPKQEFTLFWLDGKTQIVTGIDIADAMRGYSQGALAALDFHAKGDIRKEYAWKDTYSHSGQKIKEWQRI